MDQSPNNPEALLARLSAAQDLFRRHVVGVYMDNERGRPEAHGSALVVSAGRDVFLVSAAHVFDPLGARQGMYIHSTPATKRWLQGELKRTPIPHGKTREDDSIDIGVFRLSDVSLPPYPEANCYPLPIEMLLHSALPREGKHYLALGYPWRRTKVNTQRKDVTAMPYANYAPSVNSTSYGKLKLDPRLHIAMSFHHGNVVGKLGRRQKFPNPEGMSGSPVWLLRDGARGDLAWDKAPVVGILIEYRAEDKILLATDIGVALHMIAEFTAN
jgi:hypothetical protein